MEPKNDYTQYNILYIYIEIYIHYIEKLSFNPYLSGSVVNGLCPEDFPLPGLMTEATILDQYPIASHLYLYKYRSLSI